ncbi:hypothetical protein SKAU_G00228410 [Synaphobranchus kaupii]|uniref:Uncharacterized protein n=1 Tax=Synaphobranchus kaupii TaxID=118154 RepID=A0A9Q1F598_SYNKA|nr:hypothetical protein SKAU_G00228410 [Synaphobranchus kaupii]
MGKPVPWNRLGTGTPGVGLGNDVKLFSSSFSFGEGAGSPFPNTQICPLQFQCLWQLCTRARWLPGRRPTIPIKTPTHYHHPQSFSQVTKVGTGPSSNWWLPWGPMQPPPQLFLQAINNVAAERPLAPVRVNTAIQRQVSSSSLMSPPPPGRANSPRMPTLEMRVGILPEYQH